MIEGDDGVVGAVDGLVKDGVGGVGAGYGEAFGGEAGDERRNPVGFLASEGAAVAGVGVEAADGDAGAGNAEGGEGFEEEGDGQADFGFAEANGDIPEGNVAGGEHDPQAFSGEEHAETVSAAEIGEHFGVAGIGDAGEVPGFFADGGGDEGVEFTVQAGADAGADPGRGGGAGFGADFSGDGVRERGVAGEDGFGTGQVQGGGLRTEEIGIANGNEIGMAGIGGKGFEHDFRADAVGVADGETDAGHRLIAPLNGGFLGREVGDGELPAQGGDPFGIDLIKLFPAEFGFEGRLRFGQGLALAAAAAGEFDDKMLGGGEEWFADAARFEFVYGFTECGRESLDAHPALITAGAGVGPLGMFQDDFREIGPFPEFLVQAGKEFDALVELLIGHGSERQDLQVDFGGCYEAVGFGFKAGFDPAGCDLNAAGDKLLGELLDNHLVADFVPPFAFSGSRGPKGGEQLTAVVVEPFPEDGFGALTDRAFGQLGAQGFIGFEDQAVFNETFHTLVKNTGLLFGQLPAGIAAPGLAPLGGGKFQHIAGGDDDPVDHGGKTVNGDGLRPEVKRNKKKKKQQKFH